MKAHRDTHRPRRGLATAAALAAIALLAACGGVEGGGGEKSGDSDFPTKAVEITVTSSPGGSTDLIGRGIAKSMEKPLGQSVVVVNKEGGNGAVGGKEVAGSKPDGYKVAVMPQSLFAIGPLTEKDAGALKVDDMTSVAPLSIEDYVLVVPAKSPVKTLDDLLAKGSIKYGTTGPGTGSQIAQALLFASAKVKATDVPFDGGAPLVTAVLGAQVDAGATQVAESLGQIRAKKLRPLAVFSKERLEFLPGVPTAVESGHEIVVDQRRWLAGPKDMDAAALKKLQASVEKAKSDPAYRELLKKNSIISWEGGGDVIEPQVAQAREQYSELAKKFGVSLSGSS